MHQGDHLTNQEATLTLLLKRGHSNASELASVLGISVQAMRRHLRHLEKKGLIKPSRPNNGPGRPSNLWSLTKQGEHQFDANTNFFSLELLDATANTLNKKTFQKVFNQLAKSKGNTYRHKLGEGPLFKRLEKLVELRKQEGHITEFHKCPSGKGWVINDFHCAVKNIAEEYPILCEQELLTMRNSLPDCDVERVQWRIEQGHTCGFLIVPH